MGQGEKFFHIPGAWALGPVLHQVVQDMGLGRRQFQLLQGSSHALAGQDVQLLDPVAVGAFLWHGICLLP
ncbi:MAG: hypothetical protein ACLSHU_11535 [Oscillospiraceae bacterium]